MFPSELKLPYMETIPLLWKPRECMSPETKTKNITSVYFKLVDSGVKHQNRCGLIPQGSHDDVLGLIREPFFRPYIIIGTVSGFLYPYYANSLKGIYKNWKRFLSITLNNVFVVRQHWNVQPVASQKAKIGLKTSFRQLLLRFSSTVWMDLDLL